ncbi:MAG: U32 family peptidase [Candidatus Absconditabacteria bacterium]|nr:U32 family peptidase [Candidatus Absconditabacteria bacterium]
MNKPSIVAPGGSYQKAIVASTYGADEVYVGVPFTSLRMRQNKITGFDELKRTVDALHSRGTKALLTMNIFPRNTDISIFEQTVERISDVGADAIIFSDPGTFKTIRKYVPNMPLHLSTQTSTLNSASVAFRRDLGVKRVVLARELHIDEISQIKKDVPDMELEIFAHGAMCMSYSGRCLLGDYMNGRQANKGECSHNCRFKYKVWLEEERRPGKLFQLENDENGVHILSSKDLCVIDRLAELMPHVDAIKIEGRSKSELYVGSIVKAYKHVRDAIIANTPIDENIKNLVNVVPHRQYRSGFVFNKLADYPEGEVKNEGGDNIDKDAINRVSANETTETSTTLTTGGPLFNRNNFGVFTDKYIEHNSKKYFQIDPKEVITRGMKIKYISKNEIGTLEILDILDNKGKNIEKGDCNKLDIYILTDKDLQGRELLYE